MDQVTLLGIEPENEHGHRFETDARTWECLAQVLVAAGSRVKPRTAVGLLCAEYGAKFTSLEASWIEDRLTWWVADLGPEDELGLMVLG